LTHFSLIIYLEDRSNATSTPRCAVSSAGTSARCGRRSTDALRATALSRKPEKLAALELKQLREEDKLTPDLVFRDPYISNWAWVSVSWPAAAHRD